MVEAFPEWLRRLAVAMVISEQTLGPRMLEMLLLAVGAAGVASFEISVVCRRWKSPVGEGV